MLAYLYSNIQDNFSTSLTNNSVFYEHTYQTPSLSLVPMSVTVGHFPDEMQYFNIYQKLDQS